MATELAIHLAFQYGTLCMLLSAASEILHTDRRRGTGEKPMRFV